MRYGLILLALALPVFAAPDEDLGDLLEELVDDNAYVRGLARDALAKLGKKAVPHLTTALGSKSERLREQAARTLGQIGADAAEALPALRKLAADEEIRVRAAATEAIQLIIVASSKAPPPENFAEVAAGPAPRLRAALRGWENLGPAGAVVPHLLRIIETRNDVLKVEAGKAFRRYGRDARFAIPKLIELGRTKEWPRRFAISDALAGIGAPSVDPLFSEYVHSEGAARVWAKETFFKLGARVIPVALAALDSKEKQVRVAACEMLEAAGPASQIALQRLVAALHDPAGSVRRAAARAIGGAGAAGLEGIPPLVLLAADADRRAQLEAVQALGSILRGATATYRSATRMASRKERAAIALGQSFLLRYQDLEGGWDCAGFDKHSPNDDRVDGPGHAAYSVGVTGLALLALAEGGVAETHAAAVEAGLRHLIALQDNAGCYGPRESQHFLYNHATATLAMCVAYGHTRNPLHGASAQRALDFIAQARSPDFGWRYVPGGEESDTSLTCWMAHALNAGALAGLTVDPEGFAGTLRYLAQVTNLETGRVGYKVGLPVSARPSELLQRFPVDKTRAMTACGTRARLHAGAPATDKRVKLAADQCLSVLPRWNPEDGSIDLYYWFHATRLMHEIGGKPWRKWARAIEATVPEHQHPKGSGSRTGSWDPLGPWAADGGRIYSTAMMVLCLKPLDGYAWPVRFRVPRSTKLKPAEVVLHNARKLRDERIAAAARNALLPFGR